MIKFSFYILQGKFCKNVTVQLILVTYTVDDKHINKDNKQKLRLKQKYSGRKKYTVQDTFSKDNPYFKNVIKQSIKK